MTDPFDQFAEEFDRKMDVLEHFEALEEHERKLKSKLKRKYERIFHDWSQIVEISDEYISLETEHGQVVAPVMINATLAKHLQIGDELFIKAGLSAGQWHVIRVEAFGDMIVEVI